MENKIELVLSIRKMRRSSNLIVAMGVSDQLWEEVGSLQQLHYVEQWEVSSLHDMRFLAAFGKFLTDHANQKVRLISDKFVDGETRQNKQGFLIEFTPADIPQAHEKILDFIETKLLEVK